MEPYYHIYGKKRLAHIWSNSFSHGTNNNAGGGSATSRNQTGLFFFESEKRYSRFITIESSAGRYDCRKAQT
jgi:hypothetical protein